jgi:hypothetical protein
MLPQARQLQRHEDTAYDELLMAGLPREQPESRSATTSTRSSNDGATRPDRRDDPDVRAAPVGCDGRRRCLILLQAMAAAAPIEVGRAGPAAMDGAH